jgi:hypothetical protein
MSKEEWIKEVEQNGGGFFSYQAPNENYQDHRLGPVKRIRVFRKYPLHSADSPFYWVYEFLQASGYGGHRLRLEDAPNDAIFERH